MHIRKEVFLIIFVLYLLMVYADNQTPVKKFKGSANIRTGSPQDHNFRIVSGYPIFKMSPGQTETFKIYARKNPEGEPLTNVRINITDTELPVVLDNGHLSTLKNEEMAVLYMHVTAPQNIPYNDYTIKFTVESNEFPNTVYEPKPDIIVRVTKPDYAQKFIMVAVILTIISIVIWKKLHVK